MTGALRFGDYKACGQLCPINRTGNRAEGTQYL